MRGIDNTGGNLRFYNLQDSSHYYLNFFIDMPLREKYYEIIKIGDLITKEVYITWLIPMVHNTVKKWEFVLHLIFWNFFFIEEKIHSIVPI